MPSRPAGAVAPRRNTATEDPAQTPAEVEAPARAGQPVSSKARRPRIIVKAGVRGQAPTPVLAADYPVQLGKVQAPPLRDDTLARDRLLDWLSVKVHSRVVLLTAEAGYGKTTLLADFSRRTRIRILWYRLDRGDRDWVGFIAHLVAAVRVHQPGFGTSTSNLLRGLATAAPSIDAVLDAFLRELGTLPDEPTALVFDDVHYVDDSPEIKQVFREMLARGPERMSFVFASRRVPPISLARLRALGEVAELQTDDLRFDPGETERLFRESYDMPLEPSVLGELSRRTEGWAASLQLVRAAILDRSPAEVRSFISSLSGAEGHLYEYLAEEVIGDLRGDLQQFLMRTSVLESVDFDLGPIAAGVSIEETRVLIEAAEHQGLVGRRGHRRNGVRAHPLVRDFLQARLATAIGPAGVRAIHLAVASAARSFDWKASSRHFLAAGDVEEARAVVREAVDLILATGAYSAAEEVLGPLGHDGKIGTSGLVIQARLALQRASVEEALELAETAWRSDLDSSPALMTLMAARMAAGDMTGAMEAGRILRQSADEEVARLGKASSVVLETSDAGSLQLAVDAFESLLPSFRSRGADHYLGVALLNLSLLRIAMGEPATALSNAEEAIALLSKTSAGVELASARIARAEALEFTGALAEARRELERAVADAGSGQTLEVLADAARIEGLLGESSYARPLIARFGTTLAPNTDYGEQALYARALVRIQDGDLAGARADIGMLQHREPRSTVAFEARRLLAEGLVASLEGRDGLDLINAGTRLADSQGAKLASVYGRAMGALADRSVDPSGAIHAAVRDCRPCLSMLAEIVVLRLGDLDAEALEAVFAEAKRRPWRWRSCVRRVVRSGPAPSIEAAARLLVAIGTREDVPLLHSTERRRRELRGRRYGHLLSRQLADRVLVEDLGRVSVVVGDRSIDGTEIRRKVLALLCLLLARPAFASTRDEVLDCLWPDHDPASALNSLNQTVYFLRRVFEPDYSEQVSPGYVGQDGETIWLDQQLVDSRSKRCFELIRSMPAEPSAEGSVALAIAYSGPFALDFMYEEWAAAFRDQLHSAYLRVMEHAIRLDLDHGHLHRGTFLAERATAVDPDAEAIHLSLIRLYRLSGAHAAASEQYRRYARVMRDLGLEPTAFADL